ncbi:MAG: prepilin-type N-terminal cleavage/methylation domain-containing protein [Longimicrobiales bacterium]|nr:prepilin-type N-terminal cleavage/methylation domain-containing protein [Longimicrobiales bacterium]
MLTRRAPTNGFTIVEVVIALTILSVAILGMGASVGGLSRSAAEAEIEAIAVESLDDRLVQIRMDPRYALLDSIYSGTETDTPYPGATRVTTVTRVRTTNPDLDFMRIFVRVTLPEIQTPLSRQIVVGAP